MTPFRKKQALQAELTGLRHLLDISPEDPLATPLMKDRVKELESEIQELAQKPTLVPETELFFGQGPVIGSHGIEAKFAGEVLLKFQDMVTNHFSAMFRGALASRGRRKGENDAKLFLTALPTGSFGLQLSQPHVEDFITATQIAQSMEDITGLVEASAKDDESFLDSISGFHGRVLVPLKGFLQVLNNAHADCRLITGTHQASLKKEAVSEAFDRVQSAKDTVDEITLTGTFYGTLIQSGRFEFQPSGQTLISGWLADDVLEEDAIQMERLAAKPARAVIRVTTISTATGSQRRRNELVRLEDVGAKLEFPPA